MVQTVRSLVEELRTLQDSKRAVGPERKRGSRLGQRGIIWHTMELNKALRILAPLILFATASAATTGESGVDRGGKFGLFSHHCPPSDEEWRRAIKGGPSAVRDLIGQGADINAKSADTVRDGACLSIDMLDAIVS